jgi:hypothetical protein
MVASPFGRDVVRKYWLLEGLMRALALRRIDTVSFAGGNPHRQHVAWEGGGEVWVNRGAEDWTAHDHVLPQYGFYARLPGGAEAAIERRGSAVVEWARSPGLLYVNARGAAKAVAFGEVATDGGFRLERERLIPLPDSGGFSVRLPGKSLARAEAIDEDGALLRTATLHKEGEEAVLSCEPGVFAYRLLDSR